MAIKFQYNKTSLGELGKQLKMRQKALPTIKSKESALRSEVKKAKEGTVRVKVEGAKGKCEEIEREIRKNEANHVVLHCEAEKTAEMEVSSGGSFVILAIAMIALFGFMERELFYCSVCWNPVEGGGLDENDWEIGVSIGSRELLWVDWVNGGDVE